MEFTSDYIGKEPALATLFTEVFTASEGASEGNLVGTFARDLMTTTAPDDLHVWSATSGDTRAGCIIFSRLRYGRDPRSVFILSPVAVKTNAQKTGIGQKLITHGLNHLRQIGVDMAMTYGAPDHYAKTGFRQITTEFAAAPCKLSFPHGWLAQSLSGDESPLIGPCTCVPALNDPALW
jgi:putative acetyltransferase